MKQNKDFTLHFIVGTLLIWGVLDIYLGFGLGNAYTESATTWREAYLSAGLTFSTGCLMGHFFGQWRKPSPEGFEPGFFLKWGRRLLLVLITLWLSADLRSIMVTQVVSAPDAAVWAWTGHRVWLVFLSGFAWGSVFLFMSGATDFPEDSKP